MQVRRAYKFKLYKSKKTKHLYRQLGIASQVYNHCIALHKRYYRRYKKHLSKYHLQKHITKLKKHNKSWGLLGSQAIQDITDRIERGYTLFFRNLKAGVKTAPPGFKSRRRYKSFTLKQAGWGVSGNELRVGNHNFKFSKSRELEGLVKTVTLKRDYLGDFYVIFSCEVEEHPNRVASGKSVGFDFGLKNFLTSHEGAIIETPQFYKNNIAAVKKANRNLSSKKKGSNNRRKALLHLARAHKKINNKRLDFQHKLARNLAQEYDNIFVEDLNLKGMQKLWGRKISDLGFYSFLQLLQHHCNKAGAILTKVPRYFPSSKTCSNCEHILDSLSLKERFWVCPVCGSEHDRDINAAINIFRVGASTLQIEGIRAASAAISC